MNIPSVKLNNGVELPWIGLGTSAAYGDNVKNAVKDALSIGYKSIDTAWFYKNEIEVGKGIKESGLKREDVFLTSKVWNNSHGYDAALKAFDVSMKQLDVDYIDMFLIHWPCINNTFIDTWKALEHLYDQKLVRAIGVCNFLPHHLETLAAKTNIAPVVDQFECHGYFMDYETIDYCKAHNIQTEAFSPLGCPTVYDPNINLLKEQILIDIGAKYTKTPAQIALKFLLQQGIVIIPKTVSIERMKENADLFDFQLTQEELELIKTLNTHKRLNADPETFCAFTV